MLLVSGGWPRSPEEYVLGSRPPAATCPGCKTGAPISTSPSSEIANRLGFTLYPVLAPEPPAAAIDAEARARPDSAAVTLAASAEVQETGLPPGPARPAARPTPPAPASTP